MEFTKFNLKLALKNETSTADFPNTLKKFKECGVVKYTYHLKNGLYIFTDEEGDEIYIQEDATSVLFPHHADKKTFTEVLQGARAGEFTFKEFCNRAAATGISHWLVDVLNFEAAYFDTLGNVVLITEIPAN